MTQDDSGATTIFYGPLVTPQKTNEKAWIEKSSTTESMKNMTAITTNKTVDDPVLTRQTFIFAMCAALNSCTLGYDIGVSTNAGTLIQESMDLSKIQREMFIGSLNLWSIFGSLFAHWICDKYGRRYSFKVAAIGFLLGLTVMSSATNFLLLMIGRLFVGLGVGFGLAIDPLYIAEISPAAHRGRLVTWSEIALNVGIVFGFFSGILFFDVKGSLQWRLMFITGCILPLVMIVLVQTIMPESPRFLIEKGYLDEARHTLSTLYPEGYNIEPIFVEIQEAIKREQIAQHTVGWNVILHPTPAIRRMLIVGIGTAVAQQAVGIDAIQYYLIDILKESGIQSEKSRLAVLMMLGVIKLGFIVVGGHYFDKYGRRPLLFLSLSGMIIALILVAGSYFGNEGENGSEWAVVGLALYMSAFSMGMGPGAWLIPSEIFATSIRAKAMSMATFFNRITATIMSSTFLSIVQFFGNLGGFFLLLSGISLLVLLFLYFLLPETKGRSLEEMSVYFAEITNDTSVLEAEEALTKERNEAVEMTVPSHVSSWTEQGELT